MYGPLPGTIPHQVKLFCSYLTPWGLEIAGLAYWNSGATYTESDVFRPTTHSIYYNHRRADGSYVTTSQERHLSYATLDLRFTYRLPFVPVADCDLVLDVANALDSQKAIRVEEAHNNPEFAYGEDRLLLLPRRYQLGVRLSL